MVGLRLVLHALAASLILIAPPDTTVQLARGDRVVLQGLSGTVSVEVWNRSELSVADEERRGRSSVVVRREGGEIAVAPRGGRRRGRDVDLELRVPDWTAVEIRGRSLDVAVEGLRAPVAIRTIEGDVSVAGTSGDLSVHTADGEIVLTNVEGRVQAVSRGDEITVRDARGALVVESGDGDLHVEEADLSSLTAETVGGEVYFSGRLRAGGDYEISAHSGDVHVHVPRNTGATVNVSTFDGEFVTDFPATLRGFSGGKTMEFVLGDGRARLAITAFDGDIRLSERR